MAPKKTPLDEMNEAGNEAELDEAIGNLRGVLQSDEAGGLPDIGEFSSNIGGDLGSDFGAEFPAAGMGNDLSDIGSDFGNEFGGDMGGSDFGMMDGGVDQAPGSALSSNLDLIMDIPIDLQIVLGSSRMQVSGLMNLAEGATIALDKKIGDPVDITVNGRVIARGEITVLESDSTRFGVKIIDVISTKKS